MAPFCSLWRESEEIFLRRPVLKEGEEDRGWLIQVITILITIILHLIPIINLIILVIILTLIRIITIIIINFTMVSAHNATWQKAAEFLLPLLKEYLTRRLWNLRDGRHRRRWRPSTLGSCRHTQVGAVDEDYQGSDDVHFTYFCLWSVSAAFCEAEY